MSATRSRIPAFARWSALPVGLVLSAALVWQSSYAAFTATTSNTANNWATGNVALTDDDGGAAFFTTATNTGNLAPSAPDVAKCLVVTYNGSLAANVGLYDLLETSTNSLSTKIYLKVEQGTGGSFANCTGFAPTAGAANLYDGTLSGFAAAYSAVTPFGTWAPTAGAPGQTKTYRITTGVIDDIPNSMMSSTASVDFHWTATSS